MTMPSASMERGIGGRIEDAFASAKDRGEAAFVSFVTAGYPKPQGESYSCDANRLLFGCPPFENLD
jgi:hypothetical protein